MQRVVGLSVLALVMTLVPGRAAAQTCSVHLNEVNYDCALTAGVNADSCEFIELGFGGTFTPGVTAVDACGIASIRLVNGASIACGVEDTIALPSTPIPANGLFVIGRAGVPNVDLTPTSGSWSSTTAGAIQNGNPDWIRLVGDTAAQDRWYAYEFNAAADASKNCFAKAGSVGQVAYIGEDYDANTDSPPPVVREESISLCGEGQAAIYLGDDEAGNLTGPLATPGQPNACDTRVPWDSGDAGTADATAPADATALPDTAIPTDAAGVPDAATATDRASFPDVPSCGGLTFIGECQGTTVRWCDDGEIQSYDCADDGAICGLVDCTDADCYGYDCVADVGEACGTSEVELACDASAGMGCRGGVCASSAACAFDTYVENCDGAFVLYCGTTRVWDEDCSLGGTEPYICGEVAGGGVDCLGLVDAYCDPDYDLDCAPGLACVQNTCEGTPLVDAGTGSDAGPGVDHATVADAASPADAGGADGSTAPHDAATDTGATVDGAVATDGATSIDGGTLADAAGPADVVLSPDVHRGQPDAGFTEVEPGMSCGCAGATTPAGSPLALLLVATLAALARRRARRFVR